MNTGQTQLKGAQACAHPFCVVCSGSNPYGLGLRQSRRFGQIHGAK